MDPITRQEDEWCGEYHAKNMPTFANDEIGLTMRMTARLNHERYSCAQDIKIHEYHMKNNPYYATIESAKYGIAPLAQKYANMRVNITLKNEDCVKNEI